MLVCPTSLLVMRLSVSSLTTVARTWWEAVWKQPGEGEVLSVATLVTDEEEEEEEAIVPF